MLTNADLEGKDFAPVNKEVEAIKKGLSANYEGLDVLINQTFSPLSAVVSPGYASVWAGPLALLIASSLIKFFTHTTAEKVAQKRRRAAASIAIGKLKKIGGVKTPPYQGATAAQQRHELIASIMKQYIGDRFNRTAGSLTGDDCQGIISEATQDCQTANRFKEIVVNCEAVRYAAIEASIDPTQIKEIIKLIQTIDKKSRKCR
jgi:hypothetical protein